MNIDLTDNRILVKIDNNCSICGKSHLDNCCTIVKIIKHVADKEIPSRARLSMPHFLELNTLSDGSYSVTTRIGLEKGTKFGPLIAPEVATNNPEINFTLKLFKDNDSVSYLDTNNENECSWPIFITPAQYLEEQNMICYQDDNKIYFVVIKDIVPGDSLRVWYSPCYGSKMQKEMLKSQNIENDPLKDIDINVLLKKQQNIMERKQWTCKFCSKIEADVTVFAKHLITHYTAQMKKKCEICKQSFNTKKSLSSHLKIVHNTETLSSNFLQQNKPTIKSMDSSPKLQVKDLSVGGPLLNDIFTDSTDLQQPDLDQFNMGMDNQNLLFDGVNLNMENLLSENAKDLEHFNFDIDDQNQKQFVCDICLKQFNKLRLLLMHLKHHTGDFICHLCLKIFCRKENLKTHRCNITETYSCDLCDKQFTQRKHLYRHRAAIHLRKHTCVNCKRHYYSNTELQNHNCSKISDSEKEKFICSICDKVFYRSVYLKKHMRTHNQKNKNARTNSSTICEVCGLFLENKNSYYSHIKIHKQPNHNCNICGRKFYRQDLLKLHMMKHDEFRQIECSFCSKKLKTKRNLQDHIKVHHCNFQIKCKLCPATFKFRSALGKHIKTVHSSNKNELTSEVIVECYCCPICKKAIKLRSSLLRHLKKLHSDEMKNINLNELKPQVISVRKTEEKSLTNNENDINKLLSNTVKDLNDNDNIDIEVEKQIDSLIENATEKQKQCESKSDGNEVCLSIPDLTENDQEITLDNNAYILENGTIVQPQEDSGNVIIYVLHPTFPQ